MVAFKSPEDDQVTVVVLNKSANGYSLNLTLNGFTPSDSEVYQSGETTHWLYLGALGSSVRLPAYSITTIHVTGAPFAPADCDEVQTSGHGLTSDIDGNCYVDYEDLKIITDHWLDADCAEPENCEGADFEPTDGVVDLYDFSDFAVQWLWCNDPEGMGCIENW